MPVRLKLRRLSRSTIRRTNEPAGTHGDGNLEYRDVNRAVAEATTSDGMVLPAMAAEPRPLG